MLSEAANYIKVRRRMSEKVINVPPSLSIFQIRVRFQVIRHVWNASLYFRLLSVWYRVRMNANDVRSIVYEGVFAVQAPGPIAWIGSRYTMKRFTAGCVV